MNPEALYSDVMFERRRARIFALLLFAVAGCGLDDDGPHGDGVLPRIDETRVTVSGVSSGGYMAGQLRVAHSASISGAAILAGGPYGCAKNSLRRALDVCLTGGDFDIDGLTHFAREEAAAGRIDTLNHLRNDRVWLFHGSADQTAAPDATWAAAEFYENFVRPASVEVVTEVAAAHGMPTLDQGVPCDESRDPFVNNCDYDAAGAALTWLIGARSGRRAATEELRLFDQRPYRDAGLSDSGYIYVPAACEEALHCGLHIALNGCRQSVEHVDEQFALMSGFNEWADAFGIVVLYPQVKASREATTNPYGCWDWWGYSGDDYATKNGAQISALKGMIDTLARGTP